MVIKIARLKSAELFIWLRRHSGFIRTLVPKNLRHRIPGFGRLVPPPASFSLQDDYLLTRDHTHFRINRSDYVQWRLFYGVRDNALKAVLPLVTPNSVVLDIGANVGGFSIKLATHLVNTGLDAHIHCFEPNADARLLFERNVELNPGTSDVLKLHPFGLGASTDSRTLFIPANNTGAARIVNAKSGESIDVDVRKMDDISSSFAGRRVVFIKLIAGGFEGEIFKGGWDTIETHRPAIFFEVTAKWYAEHGTTIDPIIDRLTSLHYRLYADYRNQIVPFDRNFFSRVDQYYILAKPE